MNKKIWKQLTFEERKLIEQYLKEGRSFLAIAELMGRSKSTLLLEVRKGGGMRGYSATEAQKTKEENRSHCRSPRWANLPDRLEEIEKQLADGWSLNDLTIYHKCHRDTMKTFIKKNNLVSNFPTISVFELKERVEVLEMQVSILIEKMEETHNVRN